MAKVFALNRSAAQPVTINTITPVVENLGSAIPGMQTTSVLPARCVNLYTVFQGNPYLLTLSAAGNIEIHRYVSGAWTLVGGPFTPAVGHVLTPLCIHVVNDTVLTLWTDEGASNDGIASSISLTGTSWSSPTTELAPIGASNGGHSVHYKGAIWFATAIGVWCYAPLARLMTLSGVVGAFVPDETLVGGTSLTSAVVRSFNSPVVRVDTVSGSGFVTAETVTGTTSGATGTITTITRFVNALPDTGNDAALGGVAGSANLLGSFTSWDGALYFVQPKTAAGPIRLYQLSTAWEAALNVPAPQWTNRSFSGLVEAGFATVSADAGMWSLFVNRLDELCLFYSGSGSTKLAKTTSKTAPLVFTDLTNTFLPSTISTKTNLGVTLYTDDRRRTNLLQSFLIRDLSGASTILTNWDGASALTVVGSIAGAGFILPASRFGQESTFTNLQPTIHITDVSEPFPGRIRIDYVVRADPARTVDILPEYSIDGDEYFPMTTGADDSGTTGLPASPGGDAYFFNWDTFADLDGDFNNLPLRIVDRISGV